MLRWEDCIFISQTKEKWRTAEYLYLTMKKNFFHFPAFSWKAESTEVLLRKLICWFVSRICGKTYGRMLVSLQSLKLNLLQEWDKLISTVPIFKTRCVSLFIKGLNSTSIWTATINDLLSLHFCICLSFQFTTNVLFCIPLKTNVALISNQFLLLMSSQTQKKDSTGANRKKQISLHSLHCLHFCQTRCCT